MIHSVTTPSVLVVLTTGRPTYRRVAESLRLNIEQWHPSVARVDLLVNFDTNYKTSSTEDFTQPPCQPLVNEGTVIYADHDFVRRSSWLKESDKSALASISPASGYGQKKNACFLFALRNNYDLVLFWDDDEYAVYVEHTDQGDCWNSTDIIGAHIGCDADVTFGFWTGYVSPIPDSFFIEVSDSTKAALTQALSPITDVVEESTFFDRAATYYVPRKGERTNQEIPETRGGKWISGGNVGLRCASALGGYLPAYYTPTDSRGDDSVYSTGLRDSKVWQVPAGIFHDAFGVLEGELPKPHTVHTRLKAPEQSVARFCSVIKGWLAYAPTLTVLRDIEGAVPLIQDSANVLESCDSELINYFGNEWTSEPPSKLLRIYLAKVEHELDNYYKTQSTWQQLCRNIREIA